jgi:glucose/arabinose dehydrogenase/mono/diheme cytochrome c family protein
MNRINQFFILLFFAGLFSCDIKKLPPGDPDQGGLIVPEGFEVLVVSDSVGAARHMAISEQGDIYVKLRGAKPKGIVALRDVNNDGKADTVKYFGDYEDKGNYGTAMRIHKGYLYFTTAGELIRVKLTPGQLIPSGPYEVIVRDDYKNDKHGYEHIAKPIAFDEQGHVYVPFGSPGDVCQIQNRIPGEPGEYPCSQLEEHGGIWQFDESKPEQTIRDGKHYATGIRSIVAMDWNKQDQTLYVGIHGRDNLHATWPALFSSWQSAIFPSEEFMRVKEGTNGGWPYYYFDQEKKKRVLNPEYGGDGNKEGDGSKFTQPLIGFPAHWAPNDLFFYTGNQFPEHYRNGAFIAFHGSTNRAPYPQAGYFIGFIPFENGEPTGQWEVFANGFAGIDPVVNVSDAVYRPMAIAMGPDGSLYFSETEKGKIWRVMFKGDRNNFGTEQLSKMEAEKLKSNIRTPDFTRDNLETGKISEGGAIYNTYCGACHQFNGMGSPGRFPPLAGAEWVTGDKNRLIGVILNGLSGSIKVKGAPYDGVMPAHAFLKDSEIAAVLTYIRSNFGNQSSPVSSNEVGALRHKE